MMPAAKHGDPQMGVDIHLCMVPMPAPTPTPLPTPHMSVVFDPMDYIPIIGATITVCGMKRATAGTAGTVVHIPPGFPFAPKPPDKEDELFMGSSTIVADGDPMSHIAHPVLACQVAGMMSPFRMKKKGGPRAMVLPTVFNLAIPSTVFLGGPPTINLMGMAFKAGFAALGKFAKSGLFKKMRQKLFGHLKPGFLKCVILRAEPVDILSGSVSVEHRDFELPGFLPFAWNRVYNSGNRRAGLCGPGWETPADGRLVVDREGVWMHYPGVGPLYFDQLPAAPGETPQVFEPMDGARLTDHGDEWRVRTKDDRIYHFDKRTTTGAPDGSRETALSRISDLCGNWLAFARSGGRLVSIEESAGRRLDLAVEGPRLRQVALSDAATGFRHVYARYEYDAAGDLVAVIDALDQPYRFAYDAHHMVRHTDRNGLSFHYAYDTSAADGWRVVHAWGDGGLYDYRFDYLDAAGERRIADSLGNVSVIKVDERGLPIGEIDPLGGMTIYEYDDVGRTTAVVDPEGRRTSYAYDHRGNLLALERPDGAAILTEYDLQDKPAAVTDPNGGVWRQRWDARGLLLEQATPLGHVSRYEYSDAGLPTAIVNPRGARTEIHFDSLGLPTRLIDALGHITLLAHDPLGNLVVRGNAMDRHTVYRWDALSRLVGITLPSGATVQFSYDPEGNLVRHVDERGAETRFDYVGLGEIARRIQPDGHRIEYRYDTEERLVAVRNQRGETYRLARDALGRVTEETDYWGQTRRYEFDGSGYLLAAEDPLQRRILYTCDPVGRIVGKVMADPTGAQAPWEEQFGYDANGNLIGASNPHVEVARVIDPEGRLIEETQSQRSGVVFRVCNAFDEAGNRIRRSTSGTGCRSNVSEFTHDLLDRAIVVRINGGRPRSMRRDAVGNVVEEELAAGLIHRNRYDVDGQLLEQGLAKDGRALFATRYGHDRAGNLTSSEDSQFGIHRYVHDPLGRVLEHTTPQGRLERFFVDPAGDLLVTHPMSDPSGEARVTSGPDGWRREGDYLGTRYSFDRAGNLVSKRESNGRIDFAWDSNQRLIASRRTSASGTSDTRYGYDPMGRRLFKETDGRRVSFGWDGDALAMDTSDGRTREFVYRDETFEPLTLIGDTSLADGDAQPGAPPTYHYINEGNGCPTRLVDQDGYVVWGASYAAWGEIDRQHADAVDNPLRFQGQYADAESGLHFGRSRYFDPHAGCFVTQDPVGLLAGENLYHYAPNAQGWIDPYGLSCATTKKLQKLVDQAVEEIRQNPKIAENLMSPGSYRHLVEKTGLYGASFGKAVERRVAQLVAADPKLAKAIKHTGLSREAGKFCSSADFTTKAGKLFDVTTNKGVPAHAKRYGDKAVEYLTYDVIDGLAF